MSLRTHVVDYRNASYHGELKDNIHSGLGVLLDENLMFCIGQWANNSIHGRCFIVFPDHRMFFGQILDKYQNGVCVYVLGNQCYLYGNFSRGKLISNPVIDFGQLKTVLQISGMGNNLISKMEVIREIAYVNQKQKWSILESVIKAAIETDCQNYAAFLQQKFNKKYQYKIIDKINGGQLFIGLPGQTLGVKINVKKEEIISLGHYSNDRGLLGVGMKTIDTISGTVFEEGNYLDVESIIRYQTRPKNANLIIRKSCFQSLSFNNKFFNTSDLNRIWHLCTDIGFNLSNIQTEKYAQILLENPNPLIGSKVSNNSNNQTLRTQNNGSQHNGLKNQERFGQKPSDYSLQKIKEEVYKAADRRKNSHITTQDIVRQFSPSELRHTPNKRSEKNIAKEPQQSHSPYKRDKFTNRIQDLMIQRNIAERVRKTETTLPQRNRNITPSKNHNQQLPGHASDKTYTYFRENRELAKHRKEQIETERQTFKNYDHQSQNKRKSPVNKQSYYVIPKELKMEEESSFNLVNNKLKQMGQDKIGDREVQRSKGLIDFRVKDHGVRNVRLDRYQGQYDSIQRAANTKTQSPNSKSPLHHKHQKKFQQDSNDSMDSLDNHRKQQNRPAKRLDFENVNTNKLSNKTNIKRSELQEFKMEYSPIQRQVNQNRHKLSPHRYALKKSPNKFPSKGLLSMYGQPRENITNPEYSYSQNGRSHRELEYQSPNLHSKDRTPEREKKTAPISIDLYIPKGKVANMPNTYYNEHNSDKLLSKPRRQYKYDNN